MTQIAANGIALEYDAHGPEDGPPMLLVMGLGAQLVLWPMEFVSALARHGFRVIRYDNRDIGLSQKMDGARAPNLVWQMLTKRLEIDLAVPYTLSTMAADGIGLLDALGIDRAHVVGASMGGMIAQLMAVEHPDRLLSLTSIMSTTGDPKLPGGTRQAMRALMARPASLREDALVAHGVAVARAIGSPGYPAPDARLRDRVRASVRRAFHPDGLPRQLAAIIRDGDRTARLAHVRTPTLVLHGEDDPLVPCPAGRATAAAIPGAALRTFPGWGHDLPGELIAELADLIAAHAHAATDGGSSRE